MKEEGLEKCQRGNGAGGDKSRGRAGGRGAGESWDLAQDVRVGLGRGRKGHR